MKKIVQLLTEKDGQVEFVFFFPYQTDFILSSGIRER